MSFTKGTLGNNTCRDVGGVNVGRGWSLLDAVATDTTKDPTGNSLQPPPLEQGGWTWYFHRGGITLGKLPPFAEKAPFAKGNPGREQLWVLSSQHVGQWPVASTGLLLAGVRIWMLHDPAVVVIWASHLNLWDYTPEFWRFDEVYCLIGDAQ